MSEDLPLTDVAPAGAAVTRPSRLRRGLLWGCGLLAVLGVALFVFVWRTVREAEKTIQRHRAMLLPPFLPPQPKESPPEPATAAAVVEAFLDTLARVPLDERRKASAGAWDYGDEEQKKEVNAILLAHPEPLAAVEPLVHAPAGRDPPPPRDLEDQGRLELRAAGRFWLEAVVRSAVARGASREAVRAGVVLIAYGHELSRRGSVVHHLMGTSAQANGAIGILAGLRASAVDADIAAEARGVLTARESARRPLRATMEVERTLARILLLRMAGDGKGLLVSRDLGWRRAWSWTVFVAEALGALDTAVDAVEARLAAHPEDGGRLLAELKALPQSENLLLRMFLVTWPLVARSDVKARAGTRLASAGLAVAEYRAREGRLPASLSDLVPAYLPSVPIDAWDGKPLRYAAGKVWSVGSDRKDDEGTPAEDPFEPAVGEDIVVDAPVGR